MHPLVQEQLEMLLAHSTQALADHELHEAGLEHQLAAERALIDKTKALINATRFELAGGQPVEASSKGSLGLGKLLGNVMVGGGVPAEDDDRCPECGVGIAERHGLECTDPRERWGDERDPLGDDVPIGMVPTDGDEPVVSGLAFAPLYPEVIPPGVALSAPPEPDVDPETTDHQVMPDPSNVDPYDSNLFDSEGGCVDCHVRPGMLHLNGCTVWLQDTCPDCNHRMALHRWIGCILKVGDNSFCSCTTKVSRPAGEQE